MYSVAVLEDNITLRQTMEDYFNASNKYSLVFSSGCYKELKNRKAEVIPDFVLLDLHLSDVYGVDIIHNIKQAYPKSHIIIITGDLDKQTLDTAYKNGAWAYFYKPFNMKEIEKAMNKLTNLQRTIVSKLLSNDLLSIVANKFIKSIRLYRYCIYVLLLR